MALKWRRPVDWRTTRGAMMTLPERHWLHYVSGQLAEGFSGPIVVVHIGVEYGASLHCCKAGAPSARVVGVDLDCRKFKGDQSGFEFITGNSGPAGREFQGPIHLLFVDGDHRAKGVHADIAAWVGKVHPGGIVAFHDYNADEQHHEWTHGVREAVDTWDWSPTAWEQLPGVDSIVAWRRKKWLARGGSFGSIAIGVPYMKAQYEFWRWWSWLLIGGLDAGDQFLNGPDVPGEVPIPMAHNALVRRFLETDRDTLCIVEDDHVADQEVVRRLRRKAENLDFDVVCASYTTRRHPLAMVGAGLVEQDDYGEWECQLRPFGVDRTGTQVHDIAALGLVLIRRWLLEAMLEQSGGDPAACFWFDWKGRNSQDVQFYGWAKELGARVGVDRDNPIGHIGKHTYTVNEYYELIDEARKRRKWYRRLAHKFRR